MKFSTINIGSRLKVDGLVLTYFEHDKPLKHKFWPRLGSANQRMVTALFGAKHFSGQAGQIKTLLALRGGRIFLLGLGERKSWSQRKLVLVVRRAVLAAQAEKVKELALAPEELAIDGLGTERLAQLVAENVVLALYKFTQYKSKPEEASRLKGITLAIESAGQAAARAGLKVGQVVGEAVNLARDLGNRPGGEMTPQSLAAAAQSVGREYRFKVSVLGRAQMKKLGMGAILGVAHGSSEEPKFIIMEYSGGRQAEAPYVFVGKGVTFDTGGLNLKPEKGMSDMHLDMLGGAAVIAGLAAIAKLKLKLNVVGLVPAVENMPGSAGYRPGDVLRSLSGKSIEVLNTDAEGRIILADALTYAERFKPKLVIDVATLTGACMVALGLKLSGLMTPDLTLQQELVGVGELSGDYVWPLPLLDENEEDIKGTFGDVQNMGKTPYGGATTAAAFLWQFAKAYPWAHLDIAGPMKTVEGQHLAPGASGVGVRFLVELARTAGNRP